MIIQSSVTKPEVVTHNTDICIIGAGAAGMFAAVAAARNGAKVVVIHDRPVVGGNASSEIRMWIRGARGRGNNESGLVEELALMNLSRNPTLNFSIWDSVTYEFLKNEPNIELLLNCSCLDATVESGKIISVKGWQTTTQKFHEVKANIFCDCSGDSILAPLTGAEFRMGRESRSEFNEDIAPIVSDNKTMGMSCLMQVKETDREISFTPPDWAEKFTDETISHRVNINNPNAFKNDNFWWIELGGDRDSIADTEEIRHELLRITFGVWDYFKNSGKFDSKNWELDWVGFLPGKRESRRYVGDYILNQNDIRSGGHFDDLIAYGGWTMDDHDPAGFNTQNAPNHFHPAPSPFGIPYRCLYSKNIDNLMFAGRNISCTHTAMSACRVMATCGTLGQAVGTAAALAIKHSTSPRGIYIDHINELRQTLMQDDAYLPFTKRELTPVMENISAKTNLRDASIVFDGIDRCINNVDHKTVLQLGENLEINLPESRYVEELRFIFDSDLDRDSFDEAVDPSFRDYPMRCNTAYHEKILGLPEVLVKDYDIEISNGGEYEKFLSVTCNRKRLAIFKVGKNIKNIRFIPKAAYGAQSIGLYSVILK